MSHPIHGKSTARPMAGGSETDSFCNRPKMPEHASLPLAGRQSLCASWKLIPVLSENRTFHTESARNHFRQMAQS